MSFLSSIAGEFNDDERELLSLEEAWADFAFGLRTGMPLIRRGSTQEKMALNSLLDVHQQLEVYRKAIKEGSKYTVLVALKFCGEQNVPIPYWLVDELSEAITAYNSEKGPYSLDSVFSGGLPSAGKKARNERVFQQKGLQLYAVVSTLKSQGMAETDALKQALKNGNYGIGLTTARKLYQQRERLQSSFQQAISRKRVIRRN